MSANKVREFLDSRGAKYVHIRHSPAFTAAEVARSAHVTGRDFAKTLLVDLDGQRVMVVLPATERLQLAELRELLGAGVVRLGTEAELRELFPDCELGAMPPFGNLYGLPVFIASDLATEPRIAFNAGTHTDVITMAYADYAELVRPKVMEFIAA